MNIKENEAKINKIRELLDEFTYLNSSFPEKTDKIFLEKIEKKLPNLENNLELLTKIEKDFLEKIEEKKDFLEKKEFMKSILEKRNFFAFKFFSLQIIVFIFMFFAFIFSFKMIADILDGDYSSIFYYFSFILICLIPNYIFYKRNTPLKKEQREKSQVLAFLIIFFTILWFYSILKIFLD